MRNTFIKIFIVSLFVVPLKGICQDFKSDILTLRKKFSGNYSINIRTEVVSNNAQFPSTSLSGFVKVKDGEMIYKQAEEEVLYSKNYLLLISHEEKNIIVDTASASYNAAPLYFLDIDTLEKAYKSVTFTQINDKKVYAIEPTIGDVAKFVLTISNAGYLEKMEVELSAEAGGGKASIYYSDFAQNPIFPNDTFSPWRYVTRAGKIFSPTINFKNYTVDSNL